MAVQLACENCGKSFRAPKQSAGRTFRCPSCKAPIQAPVDATDVSSLDLDGLWDTVEQEAPPAAQPVALSRRRDAQRSRNLLKDPLVLGAGILVVLLLIAAGVAFWLVRTYDQQYRDRVLAMQRDAQEYREIGELRKAYEAYEALIAYTAGSDPGDLELRKIIEDSIAERDRLWPLVSAEIEREALEATAQQVESERQRQPAAAQRKARQLDEDRQQREAEARKQATSKVLLLLQTWMEAQKLDDPGEICWQGGSVGLRLQAVRDYKVLRVDVDQRRAEVSVEVLSSNDDGRPLRKVWRLEAVQNAVGDWKLARVLE